MHEMSTQPPSEESLQRGHQADHFRTGVIWAAGIVFALLVVLVVAAMWAFEWGLTRWYGNVEPYEIPRRGRPLQFGPAIDANQPLELRQLRAAERRLLTSYAWQDEQQQWARIPLERALELWSERGLPAQLPGYPTSTEEAISTAPPARGTGSAAPDDVGQPQPLASGAAEDTPIPSVTPQSANLLEPADE